MRMVLYEIQQPADCIVQFQDAVSERNLIFNSYDLVGYGFDARKDLEPAIKRAMNTCMMEHIPVKQHFKKVYLDDEGQLKAGWRLSQLALKLVLINAPTSNPLVSRIQIEAIT